MVRNDEFEDLPEEQYEAPKQKFRPLNQNKPEPVQEQPKELVKYVETEINLTLINDKLNYIISLLKQ